MREGASENREGECERLQEGEKERECDCEGFKEMKNDRKRER